MARPRPAADDALAQSAAVRAADPPELGEPLRGEPVETVRAAPLTLGDNGSMTSPQLFDAFAS